MRNRKIRVKHIMEKLNATDGMEAAATAIYRQNYSVINPLSLGKIEN